MDRINQFLQERQKNNLLRVLRPANFRKKGRIRLGGREYIDFSSNDYLGLSSHGRLLEAAKAALDTFGVGSSASRLLSGDLELHHQLEQKTAAFKGKERALVFNSGYQANLGIISALCKRGDVIFSDRLNHASIIDGILLSGVRCFRFNHNDMAHLASLLKKERKHFKEAFVISETIFSMDGDICPLKGLVELKEKYNCVLYLDEAHATGIFGKSGSGLAEEEGLTEEIDFIMGTFSKALGGFGAYLACAKKIAEYLINSCRSFIYSTALPAPVIAANLAALELIEKEPFRRKTLLENSACFRNRLEKHGLKVKGSAQIIPLIVGDNRKAINLSRLLQDKGYWALPIRTPSVAPNQARVRFSLSYDHSREILERAANDICQAKI